MRERHRNDDSLNSLGTIHQHPTLGANFETGPRPTAVSDNEFTLRSSIVLRAVCWNNLLGATGVRLLENYQRNSAENSRGSHY